MKNEDLLALYGIYSKSINSYTTIIWAFPILFVGMLITGYNFLHNDKIAISIVVILGYLLIHAFFKHTYIHENLRDALRNVENELRVRYNMEGKKFIPDDNFGWFFRPPFLSHIIVRYSLLLINTLVLVKVLTSTC